WRFKDMDEEVARGDLSQSANLADKNRDAQKKLKEYDAEVKNKGLAQTKNLKQKDRDAQKKLKEYDAEVKNKGLAQTENLEQEDRKIQEYMKLLNTDETLPQGKKLAEKDRKIQDYMKVLDTEDKTLPQGGRLAEEDRKIQEYMKALNADQTLPQGQRLMQRDFDTQDALVYLDYEIKALAFARYHWWILDYGLAREYALRPLEFGYLSYHSALNDTMGGFSTAEDLYNLIFNGVSLGLNILGAVPNVVAGVEDVADMVDNYKKENLVNDIKNAQAGQANAKALSEELEQKATDETAAGEEAMKRAEEAKAEANRHNSEADRYDKEAQTYFEQEAAARERGRTDIAEDFRQKKEEAYYNAANERMLADQKSAEEGMALSEAQQHYQSAANYNDQKTAADQAYDSYVQQEQDASQSLKERIGLADTEEDIRQSQANVKQMQAEQDQISRERADASNQRAAYEAQADAYEQEAAGYRNAADMSYRVGDHATETNDTSAKMFYLEGDDARNMASKSETSAAEARMKANSEAEREQSLKNASAQYDTQIQAEKERQNAALKKQQQQQAEYAVLTGNATEEQKNIYKQSQQEKENSKTSKKVASWTDRMPSSAGEIVTGVEGAATRGIRTIFGQ
ncbi:MAG: hypothetical protein J6Y03_03520, partial [Alphaproteobacteria bacterium]|nr:hypothetical protein [Alphaproteobacteria bacterium]